MVFSRMISRPFWGSFIRITLMALGCAIGTGALGQDRPLTRPGPPGPGPQPPQAHGNGLISGTDAASPGYTLFAPLRATTTYLVDLRGELVHSWPSACEPGEAVYLLDDGSLLRTARDPHNKHFVGGGLGGRIERIAIDGTLLWQFAYADEKHCQHHDARRLPSGNVLFIAWEKKTRAEALAAGLDPERMTGPEMWPDTLIEVEPQGASGGKIVWAWHVWDHLVQDLDPKKPSYGEVVDHPELVDVNYRRTKQRQEETPAELERLRSLGYIGGGAPDEGDGAPAVHSRPAAVPNDQAADWCHTNSVDYKAEFDQIMLSVHSFNEIWIIDHSTTTQEAAGHTGGRYGRGGDLLYRCGNPWAYLAGDAQDQTLFAQHDARWIPENLPGAGHVTVFNNGEGRRDGRYSSVIELVLPVDARGVYRRERWGAFVPPTICWEYTAPGKAAFFAGHLSGAERLLNGNTLICSGEEARIFEVTPAGKTVWDYVNPYGQQRGADPGQGRPAANPRTQPAHRATPPPPPPAGPPPPPGGGLYRAARYAPDHPGVLRVLEAKGAGKPKPGH
jgi:hypothetical protein